MRRLVVLLGVLVGGALWAVPAFAAAPDPATLGYIEVCKTTGSDIAAGTLAAGAAPTPACGFPRHRPIAARPAMAPSSGTDEARRAANSE